METNEANSEIETRVRKQNEKSRETLLKLSERVATLSVGIFALGFTFFRESTFAVDSDGLLGTVKLALILFILPVIGYFLVHFGEISRSMNKAAELDGQPSTMIDALLTSIVGIGMTALGFCGGLICLLLLVLRL